MENGCGDVTCGCCYPEFQCYCLPRPDDAEPGEVHACPTCGSTMVALAFRDGPGYARTAPILARNGIPEPRLTWRRLTPATRIPGSA